MKILKWLMSGYTNRKRRKLLVRLTEINPELFRIVEERGRFYPEINVTVWSCLMDADYNPVCCKSKAEAEHVIKTFIYEYKNGINSQFLRNNVHKAVALKLDRPFNIISP